MLLLDEPLSALDAELRERLGADLRRILQEAGTTALMVTHDHEEAFAVADRIAVLRAGRLVQEGDISEVWRAPADPATALFLGYARVLDGQPASRVLAAVGQQAARVAVRRSALVLAEDGPLGGTVLSARVTPVQVRLVVDVDGVGEMDAVARLDQHPAVRDRVRLAVDSTRLAVIRA
jgi:thiamine transport system ATP-binding protein